MLQGKQQCSDPFPYCTLIHRYHSTTGKQSTYLLLRDIFFSLLQLELASLTEINPGNYKHSNYDLTSLELTPPFYFVTTPVPQFRTATVCGIVMAVKSFSR